MDNYKPNSNKYKNELNQQQTNEVKPKKVVSGPVTVKKKSEVQKFADVFISEDANKVKSYIMDDILIPTIKKTIYDIFTESLNMIFFGGSGRGKSNTTAGKVSYRQNYSNSRDEYRTATVRRTYDYDNIVVKSRGEAEAVIDQMGEIIDAYGFVRVSDFYEIVGVDGDHTANKYGWMDIRSAEAIRLRNGDYLIKLPRAVPID